MRNSRDSSLKKKSDKEITNMEEKYTLISFISLRLSFFKLDSLKWFKKLDETLEDDTPASQAELNAHIRLMSRLISWTTLLFLIIYRYKLPELIFYLNFLP